jgi:internalin A
MNILEKDDNKENKIVLVSVYELLKYYKKAFDLYMGTNEENDINKSKKQIRKQKIKVFEMEQRANKYGDNDAIKNTTDLEIINEEWEIINKEINNTFYSLELSAAEYLQAYSTYKEIKGATDDEINIFEKEIGLILPEDFKKYYKTKNGSGALKILNTPEFSGWKTYLIIPLETIRLLLTTGAFCSRKLLPFAVAGMGGTWAFHGVYLAFDFEPVENDKKGQIIRYVYDDGIDINYIATTFTELLKKTKTNLKNTTSKDLNGIRLHKYLNNIFGRDGRIIHKFSGF